MAHAPKMDWSTDNNADSFKLFSQRLQLYFTAKKIPEAEQTAHILLQVGEEGLRRFNSWAIPEAQQTSAAILDRFREQLEPAENFPIARLKLTAYRQEPHESLDDFVNRCKLQVLKCAFTPAETNERLPELIIASTGDSDFQKNLLSKDQGFTLEEALRLGRTYEATASHIQQLNAMRSPANVQAIRTNTCRNCGGTHAPRQCPAYKSKCNKRRSLGQGLSI